MFKLSSTLAMIYLATVSLAAPGPAVSIKARGADASVNVEVCTGNPGTGCVSIPIGSDSCNNLDGGLVFLNKEISSAIVPGGIVCTFFEDFGCLSEQGGADVVVLTSGTWSFFSVPGTAEPTVDFNDLTSSFSCSPL
ncbi:hypothetical protein HYPSUDRAFT_195902 [Hypholoma sublateritium FD-334 SS-4]|uniref:Uncharacterized protein n=1 Tax=Hypholoma sublateritium (strain FD-334 SS-4) TaxID=945553 RepID=A0A0D2N8E0_HYPSF|nr:hypothetical protein HYPSUDRAFT_195902 [Hypholoma sublateritium FD-334 SS-4]